MDTLTNTGSIILSIQCKTTTRPLIEVTKAGDSSVQLHVGSSVCVALCPRKLRSPDACTLPALCEGVKSEEDHHGGRAVPGLLRSLHQASDQQRSVAQQGDTQSS